MQTYLVDKFPLERIGVGVEVAELYEAELAKLGHAAVGRLRLDGGTVRMVIMMTMTILIEFLSMMIRMMDEPEGRVGRAPSPRF